MSITLTDADVGDVLKLQVEGRTVYFLIVDIDSIPGTGDIYKIQKFGDSECYWESTYSYGGNLKWSVIKR